MQKARDRYNTPEPSSLFGSDNFWHCWVQHVEQPDKYSEAAVHFLLLTIATCGGGALSSWFSWSEFITLIFGPFKSHILKIIINILK